MVISKKKALNVGEKYSFRKNSRQFRETSKNNQISQQSELSQIIIKNKLKEVTSSDINSEVEYYLNAKNLLWVIWRHHKNTYGKRFPDLFEILFEDLDRFILINENMGKKWTSNIDLIRHFEMYCNLK